jgi:hypothetical protein
MFQYKIFGKYHFLILILCLFKLDAITQNIAADKKVAFVHKSEINKMHVDGKLDEEFWSTATILDNFIQRNLEPGKASNYRTTVYFTYDDYAIYLGVKMYDPNPENIFAQYSERDGSSNSDKFTFTVDPYNGGTNGFLFSVTPTNVQQDARLYNDEEDYGWNAVWLSKTSITTEGWIAEIKIPFAALRIPNVSLQSWAANFQREVRKVREISTWNEINPNLEGDLNQCGIIEGFANLKTPVRLSISPYASYVRQNFSGNLENSSTGSFNGGLDLKYGINDAFTIDATLVPDFNDVRSDDLFQNLTPFEVEYTDYRPFFTEGLDIFSKGNLFYSRRIGSSDLNINKLLGAGIIIKELPSKNRILNASKLTGRTKGGLGVGVFNAIEKESFATIIDQNAVEKRIKISPLTNYNVVVLDQILPNNSSISLINTNVMREGSDYDANVTGTDFILRNKANSNLLGGTIAFSQLHKNGWKLKPADLGHSINLYYLKTAGVLRYNFEYSDLSDDYNPNDLAYLTNANQCIFSAGISINRQTPHKNNLKASYSLDANFARLYKPDAFTNFSIDFNSFVLKKSWFAYGFNASLKPFGEDDYFEPRVFDFITYYHRPGSASFGGFISTDYSKPVAADVSGKLSYFNQAGRYTASISTSLRFLINDHISLFPTIDYSFSQNDEGRIFTLFPSVGYEQLGSDDVIFGRRNIHVVTPNIFSKFIINDLFSFTLRVYHFWNLLEYSEYGKLDKTGSLSKTPYTGYDTTGESLHNNSAGFFNIDANFVWRFVPGSTLSLFYTQNNNDLKFGNERDGNYVNGIENILGSNRNINTGIKILYFLDYWNVKKALSEKK